MKNSYNRMNTKRKQPPLSPKETKQEETILKEYDTAQPPSECKISVTISSDTEFEGLYNITISDESKDFHISESTNSNCTSYFTLPANKRYHIVVSSPSGMSPSAQHSWLFITPDKKSGCSFIFKKNR